MARQATVRLRLAPVSLFTSLVAILLTGGLLVADQRAEARRELARDAATQAKILGGNCAAALAFGDAAAAGETLASLREHPDISAAAVYDQAGARLAAYRSPRFPDAAAPERATPPGESFGSSSLEVSAPIESGTERAGSVFLQYDLSALDARLRRLLLLMAGVAGGALGVAYLLLSRLQTAVTAPLQGVVTLLEDVSRGDLTGSVRIHGGGELGRLGDSITTTIASLRDVIGRVEESFLLVERVAESLAGLSAAVSEGSGREEAAVGTLAGTAVTLSTAADRVANETEALQRTSEKNVSALLELTRSVEAVARNAEGFTASAGGTSAAINGMSDSLAQVGTRVAGLSRVLQDTSAAMAEIDRAVGEVRDLSARTRHVADGLFGLASGEGQEARARAEEGMREIRDLVASLRRAVEDVGRRSEEINSIVAIVADIADSTNLLALNASILAAQAGEHGRGFAVVATEIRQLSGKTDASIRQISALIEAIQAESRRAVGEVARGAAVVEHGTGQVAGLGGILERVVAGARETSELNAQIAARADRQAEGSARVAASLADLAPTAEQLLHSSGEQEQASKRILRIATETGEQAALVKRSAGEQLATVTALQHEAEGATAMGERLLESAGASRAGAAAVQESIRVIEDAIRGNRARAQALRDATEQLAARAQEIRERLAVFRLRA